MIMTILNDIMTNIFISIIISVIDLVIRWQRRIRHHDRCSKIRMVAKNRTRPETWWLLRNLSRPFRSRTDPVAFPIIHTPTIVSGGYLKSRLGQRLESGNFSATLTHSLTSLESQRLKKVTTTSDQRDSDSVQGVNMALLTICCMTIG